MNYRHHEALQSGPIPFDDDLGYVYIDDAHLDLVSGGADQRPEADGSAGAHWTGELLDTWLAEFGGGDDNRRRHSRWLPRILGRWLG